MTSICKLDQGLLSQIESLRLDKDSQGNAAIICKINKDKFLIVQEHPKTGFMGIEDLEDMLPDSAPRYVVLSVKLEHQDGRVSYPMVFVYYTPDGVNPELNMLYASSKSHFQKEAKMTKVLDVQDAQQLTLEWLRDNLK